MDLNLVRILRPPLDRPVPAQAIDDGQCPRQPERKAR